jgi:hypothetical protein
LTFETPQVATTAKKEVICMQEKLIQSLCVCVCACVVQMDGGMIRGVDVWVSYASDENGYVELTPEAANNPWAVIGEPQKSTSPFCNCQFSCLRFSTAADRGKLMENYTSHDAVIFIGVFFCKDSSHNKQEPKLKSKRSVKVYGPADF